MKRKANLKSWECERISGWSWGRSRRRPRRKMFLILRFRLKVKADWSSLELPSPTCKPIEKEQFIAKVGPENYSSIEIEYEPRDHTLEEFVVMINSEYESGQRAARVHIDWLLECTLIEWIREIVSTEGDSWMSPQYQSTVARFKIVWTHFIMLFR